MKEAFSWEELIDIVNKTQNRLALSVNSAVLVSGHFVGRLGY